MNDTIPKGDKKEEKAMSGMKKTLSIFLAVLMLFSSLPFGVFAESAGEPKTTQSESEETKTDEESAEEKTDKKAEDNSGEKSEQEVKEETYYKIGETYVIDGVKYKVNTDETVEVLGGTEDTPSRVEILSYLGDFPVIKLEGAFRGKATKELIVPETVKEIRSLYLANVENMEIKGDNVRIDGSLRYNTKLTEIKENWKDGRVVISGYLILSEEKGDVVLGPEIKGMARDGFKNEKEISALTILNPNFLHENFTTALKPIIYGFKGSTAEKIAKSGYLNFVAICDCEGAEPVEATKSYCDGTVGYKADRWCSKCELWQCGHKINDEISHFDENGDGVCDNCGLSADAVPVGRNSIKNKFTWTLYDEGTLLIIGSGTLYNSGFYFEQPWSYYSKNVPIKKVIISGNVSELKGDLFENCQELESVVLPDTVEKISNEAGYSMGVFNKCISLKEINWPKSLTYIGNYAFGGCKSLEKVELNDNIEYIGDSAFSGCQSIKSLQLPEKLKYVSAYAFCACSSLKDIKFNDNLERISEYAFAGCTSLKSIQFNENLKFLGIAAFKKCTSLESVKFNDKLETIGAQAFSDCVALKNPEFNSPLKRIDKQAFYGCTGIIKIQIPKNIEVIGEKVFYNCTSLKDIVFEGEHTDVGGLAFHNTAASNDPNNIRDGMFYISNYLIEEITPGAEKLVIGPEITHVARFQNSKTKLREIVVCNPQCDFSYSVSPYTLDSIYDYQNVVIKSSANAKARKLRCKEFIPICVCGGGKTVPESFSYCDGTFGYTEGVWCEDCGVWASGHEKKAEINHIDKNKDKICDYCKQPIDTKIIDQGKCGKDISWHLTEDGKLFIDGTGDMFNYGSDSASPWAKYKGTDTIKFVEFSDSVISIGNFAFYGLDSIKSVEFPRNIMNVGNSAFAFCSSLEEAVFPITLFRIYSSAFYGCKSLKTVSLSQELTYLGEYAFRGCSSLKSISISNKCRVSGKGLFYGCSALENVEYMPSSETIPDYMFYGCVKLKNLKFSSKLLEVGYCSFYNCKNLKTLDTTRIRSVDEKAFAYCSSLDNLTFRDLQKVEKGAFLNCKSLKTIKISDENCRIAADVFDGCSALESFSYPKNAEFIGWGTFRNCSSLKSITIPKNVEFIGEDAFASCSSLKSITIPAATNKIYSRAFYKCDNLETITFGNKAVNILPPAKDKKDKTIVYPTLPNGVTVIAENGSTAEQYADKYKLKFTPSVKKKISSMVIDKFPSKRMYFVGTDAKFSAAGAVLTVKYEDGSTVEIRNNYTVDWKDSDIAKVGSYRPVLKYGDREVEYKIRVLSEGTYDFIGTPKERFIEINCFKDEWVPFSFTPTETRTYQLYFDCSSGSLYVKDEAGNKVQTGTSCYIPTVFKDLEAGKTYKLYVKATSDAVLRIYEFDDIKFKLLEDGTYSA